MAIITLQATSEIWRYSNICIQNGGTSQGNYAYLERKTKTTSIKILINDRYAFGIGDFYIEIAIVPKSGDFIKCVSHIHATNDWHQLSMERISWFFSFCIMYWYYTFVFIFNLNPWRFCWVLFLYSSFFFWRSEKLKKLSPLNSNSFRICQAWKM